MDRSQPPLMMEDNNTILLSGSSSFHRSPQAEGVPAPHHFPEEPPQVRPDWGWGEEDLHAEVHQDRWQGPHRRHLPCWIHGWVDLLDDFKAFSAAQISILSQILFTNSAEWVFGYCWAVYGPCVVELSRTGAWCCGIVVEFVGCKLCKKMLVRY